MAFTITVNSDHTLTYGSGTLGYQNEMAVAVAITLDAAVTALATGKLCYLDFLLPDGTPVYKGSYDGSGGTINATIGATDQVLALDGAVGIQFVIRDVAPPNATSIWKSELKTAVVKRSANAATSATAVSIPALAEPGTYPAQYTAITDAGGYYAAGNVEEAMQEVGADIALLEAADTDLAGAGRTTETVKANADAIALKINKAGGNTNPFAAMPYVGTAPIVESGSNAYGAYVKYADGTMVCTRTLDLGSTAVTTASGSMFISAEKTWTFPEAFHAAPVVSGTLIGTGLRAFVGATGVTTELFNFLVVNTTSITVATSAYLNAIGRWKA